MKENTIPQMFFERAALYKEKAAFMFKEGGLWKEASWVEAAGRIRTIANFLFAMGVRKNDKVVILSENRLEWAYADIAILSCGAVTVPVYLTDSPQEAEHIVSDTEAVLAFVSTKEHLPKFLYTKKKTGFPRKIVVYDMKFKSRDVDIMTLGQCYERGREFGKAFPDRLDRCIYSQEKDAVASIIYTSGTTGPPKGVMLTHDNFLSDIRLTAEVVDLNSKDICLSFLPLSHVFERTAGYYLVLQQGGTIAYAENMESIAENAGEVSATLFCAVPRVYEKIYGRILEKVIYGSALKKNIFFWAVKVGREYVKMRFSWDGPGVFLFAQYLTAKLLVFRKIRGIFGSSLRFSISGGAPLPKEIGEFFYAAGITILEGYGLTETSPAISVNTPKALKFGTVGRPIPGIDVKIAEDGEILTKGPHIMKGYYRNQKATDEVIKDSWFRTGDIGHIDKQGFLVITDRKKDIIVTSNGKNISPQNIENLLTADRYISQVMVYGDKKNYLTALIVPDFEEMHRYVVYKNLDCKDIFQMVKNPQVLDFIQRRIEGCCSELARYEKVKKFVLIEQEFTQSAGELTPTLKLRRKEIVKRYSEALEGMYE